MIQYELLETFPLTQETISLRSQTLPELVHQDDPAIAVMTDFSQNIPNTISPEDTLNDAINEMKMNGVHLLLVVSAEGVIHGVLGSEDALGEKPIQLMEQRRIARDSILVKMLMVPIHEITLLRFREVEQARVGNVVQTLKQLKKHYALVLRQDEQNHITVRGIFNASQISKQLHTNIDSL